MLSDFFSRRKVSSLPEHDKHFSHTASDFQQKVRILSSKDHWRRESMNFLAHGESLTLSNPTDKRALQHRRPDGTSSPKHNHRSATCVSFSFKKANPTMLTFQEPSSERRTTVSLDVDRDSQRSRIRQFTIIFDSLTFSCLQHERSLPHVFQRISSWLVPDLLAACGRLGRPRECKPLDYHSVL